MFIIIIAVASGRETQTKGCGEDREGDGICFELGSSKNSMCLAFSNASTAINAM